MVVEVSHLSRRDIPGIDVGYETIFMYWIWFADEFLAMPWSLRSHSFPDGIYLGLIGYETIFMYCIWFACESLAMPWSLRSHSFPNGICLERFVLYQGALAMPWSWRVSLLWEQFGCILK